MRGICFFNDTATTEIYTLSLHDALPILKEEVLTQEVEQSYKDLLYEGEDPKDIVEFKGVLPVDLMGLSSGILLDRMIEDRKSTRLNSSHANISYAVFCLKKNKLEFVLSL